MKVPAGVTVHRGGKVYKEGEDWPEGHPVPDHLKDADPPKTKTKE